MYKLKQVVFTKKPHVCGCNEWRIVRLGIDLKLECLGCKRVIMLTSFDLDKRLKPTLSKKELIKKEEYDKQLSED